jgi:FdhE protein
MAHAGPTAFEPIPIGEVAKPPFARLPDPPTTFARRATRLRSLAERHELRPFLTFVADLSDAQHRVQETLSAPALPPDVALARSRQFKMPPLDRSRFTANPEFDALWEKFSAMVELIAMPESARDAIERLRSPDATARSALIAAALNNTTEAPTPAEHAFVAAMAQVHFARLAAQIDVQTLTAVGDGACPVCGAPPICSLVVGWSGAQNTRFCACSLCGTLWNYPRVKCTLCGSTEDISYQEIAGGAPAVKAETCGPCGRYVKILRQDANPSLDPVADDIATLGLDLLLRQSEYRRGGANPFLLGY